MLGRGWNDEVAIRLMWTGAKNVLVTALLAAAAALAWWLGRSGDAAREPDAPGRPVPQGYYLSDAVLFGTDAAGDVFYRIRAGRVERPEHQPRLDLEDVRVEFRAGDDSRWQVRADRASTPNDHAYLDLHGDVRVVKEAARPTDATLITTDALRYVPDEYLARTDRRVSILVGDDEISGTGMEADLKTNRFVLESQIHGEFFP